ncbi:MAG: hypothetical protein WCG87_07485 [Bacteroidota bacterium]
MKKWLIALYIIVSASYVQAQNKDVDNAITTNSYTLQIDKNGDLTGTGAAFIMKKAASSQFIMIGENHNTKEIPELTTSLFKALNKQYNYTHLALEQDAPMMRKVSQPPYKANKDSIFSLAAQYPYGFTFVSDQELAMIADITRYLTIGNAIWGLDQSFGAIHVVDEIMRKNPKAIIADTILNKIRSLETKRDLDKYTHYMSHGINKNHLAQLSKFKTGDPSNPIDFGINSLIMSDSIYTFMNTHRAFEGCELREHYMKTRFIEEYYKSVSTGEQIPKVLIKMGTSHIMAGFEPNTGVLNIGSFIREGAIANESSSYSINASIYRTDNSDWDYNKYEHNEVYKLFTRHASVNNWTLIDLHALKSLYYNGKMKGIISKEDTHFFEENILAFDAILLIGNGNDATFTTCKCTY